MSADHPELGEAQIPVLGREELLALLKDPAVALVDVLPAESYAAGHLPGALNLPLARVREDAARLLPDQGQKIIVYCNGFT